MEKTPYFIAAKNILETVFPGDKKRVRLADVGCLEGGFAVEFARMGFNVLGIEIRESNFAACNFVKSKTNLPNLAILSKMAKRFILSYGNSLLDALKPSLPIGAGRDRRACSNPGLIRNLKEIR